MTLSGPTTRMSGDLFAVLIVLWRSKLLIVGFALLGLSLGILYLHRAEYEYTAQMRVIPPRHVNTGLSDQLGQLGGLASLVGIRSDGGGASSFRLYLEEFTSRESAEQLSREPDLMQAIFEDEWDEQERSWRKSEADGGLRADLFRLLGFPETRSAQPNAARLQEFLQREISIDENPRRAVVIVSLDHEDPELATTILARLDRTIDQRLKREAIARATEHAEYLTRRLATVSLADQRLALVEALSEQERQIMLASSQAPYAAEPLGAPVASLTPTKPNPVVVLLASFALGLAVGAMIAIARAYAGSRQQAHQ